VKLKNINQINSEYTAILLHGNDAGLIETQAQILSKGAETTTFQYDEIVKEPALLEEKLFGMNFFGDKIAIKIRQAGDKLTKILKPLLEREAEALLILMGGELATSSSLRKLFDKGKNLASIGCYHDEARDIASLIRDTFRKENVKFDEDVIRYLAANLGNDRMITASELQKICLYAGDKTLKLEDVQDLIGNNSDLNFSDLCNAIADKNFTKIEDYYKRLILEGTSPIAIIRIVYGYFNKLLFMADKVNCGETIERAVATMRPPIFFRQAPIVKGHLRKWNKNRLIKAMQLLLKAEADCKSSYYPPEIMCRYYLIKLAV